MIAVKTGWKRRATSQNCLDFHIGVVTDERVLKPIMIGKKWPNAADQGKIIKSFSEILKEERLCAATVGEVRRCTKQNAGIANATPRSSPNRPQMLILISKNQPQFLVTQTK